MLNSGRSGMLMAAAALSAQNWPHFRGPMASGIGDGAGAVVLQRSDTPGILSSHLHADGSHADILSVPGSVSGGSPCGIVPTIFRVPSDRV